MPYGMTDEEWNAATVAYNAGRLSNEDPAYGTVTMGVPVDPVIAGTAAQYVVEGVTGSAALGGAAALGVGLGAAKVGGSLMNGNGYGLENPPRTDVDSGWFKDLLSWFLPGVQESLGELPEQIRGYAQVHGGAVKTWDTGTARFWLFADGWIGTVRKSGQVSVWKPAKHIVVPRNPRVGTLVRANKRTNRLISQVAKRAKKR